MRRLFEQWANAIWYPESTSLSCSSAFKVILLPLSFIYRAIVSLRQLFYHFLPSKKFPVPICVVGNLTVGGTGKTPFVIFLANYLKEQGYKPGIVSRGYGGQKKKHEIIFINGNADPNYVGDEAKLIFEKTHCPVVVGSKRCLCVTKLLEQAPEVNIIISDDGLQHYAMPRDIEIIVVDGKRLFGNQFCLPAGPLREPISRLNQADFVVVKKDDNNGDNNANESSGRFQFSVPTFPMQVVPKPLVNLHNTFETRAINTFTGQTIRALTGIGNPKGFFDQLRYYGLELITHTFPDHHQFRQGDFQFASAYTVIMTEKDAIKCQDIIANEANLSVWYFPIEAHLPNSFCEQFLRMLHHG